jgi:hypothetical protein
MKAFFAIFKEMFKKKELLECPKTGIKSIDPDGNGACVDCVKKFLAGRKS